MKTFAQIPVEHVEKRFRKMDTVVGAILMDQFGRRKWESEFHGGWKVNWMPFLQHLEKIGRLKEFYSEILKREKSSENNKGFNPEIV